MSGYDCNEICSSMERRKFNLECPHLNEIGLIRHYYVEYAYAVRAYSQEIVIFNAVSSLLFENESRKKHALTRIIHMMQ